MADDAQLGKAAAMQLGGSGAEQHGGPVATTLQLGGWEAEHHGGAAAVPLGVWGAEQHGGAAATALQLGGWGAEQHGAAVAALQLGSWRAEQQGGAAEVGAEQQQQQPRSRWVKEESKAVVRITREMLKQYGLNRLKPESWHEVAGRLEHTKRSESWTGGPTPRRTAVDCRTKYSSLWHYCKRRSQWVHGKAYEFAEVGDPIDGVAGDEELLDAAEADGDDLHGPLGASADEEALPDAAAAAEALPGAGGPWAAPAGGGASSSSPPPWSPTEINLLILLYPEAKKESMGKPWKLLSAKLSRVSPVKRSRKDCKRRMKKLIRHFQQQTEKDREYFPALEAMQIIVMDRSFDLNL